MIVGFIIVFDEVMLYAKISKLAPRCGDPSSATSESIPLVETAATCHADPLYTLKLLAEVLKYKSPAVKLSPSLS